MTLSIPAPCDQRWADMTPIRPDCRHCAICERQIVDFSTKTDAEILAHLRRSGGKVCGRFRADQLERPLVAARSNLRRGGLTAAAASVAAVLAAQQPAEPVPPQPVEQRQPVARERVFAKKRVEKEYYRVVSGKVVNETGEPIARAMITFSTAIDPTSSTVTLTLSQSDGSFWLRIPIEVVKKKKNQLVLTVSPSGGFIDQSIVLPPQLRKENLAILPIRMILSDDPNWGIVGQLQYVKPSLKSRIRHFFQKIF